ncbi:hypothetical protein [Bacillus sp. 165]|nr:hypothetical protein [Bacillus sp. 165]
MVSAGLTLTQVTVDEETGIVVALSETLREMIIAFYWEVIHDKRG